MGINKYNPEGYHDPTVYAALTKIEQEEKNKHKRPLVFICSPFAGDVTRNIQNARRYSKFTVEHGAIPLAPHLLFPQFMDDRNNEQRRLALSFGMVLLSKSDEIWIFGDSITKGMKQEIKRAHELGVRIRYFLTQNKETPV